jgi:catechol 2,3-dioxygenase-like lactoylglutathione lyase family enzyme
MLESRISIITLGVRDMAKSRAFYEALGWKAAGASNDAVTFFQGRGIVLGLFGQDALAEDAGIESGPQPEFRSTAPVSTLAYNCRSEAEVDDAFAHALSCGAKLLKQPQKVFWGGYSGYFADPDGHLWEVAHNPFAGFDADGHLKIDGSPGNAA